MDMDVHTGILEMSSARSLEKMAKEAMEKGVKVITVGGLVSL